MIRPEELMRHPETRDEELDARFARIESALLELAESMDVTMRTSADVSGARSRIRAIADEFREPWPSRLPVL